MECNCKDCTKRHLGCHSTCKEYKDYKDHMEKQKEKKLKERKINAICFDLFSHRCKKISHNRYQTHSRYTSK